MDLSLFGQSRDAERRRPAAHPVLAPGSPTPRARGPTRRFTQLNKLLWLLQSGASEDGHFLSLRRTQTLHSPGLEKSLNLRGFPSAMGSFVHYFSPTRKSEEPIALSSPIARRFKPVSQLAWRYGLVELPSQYTGADFGPYRPGERRLLAALRSGSGQAAARGGGSRPSPCSSMRQVKRGHYWK